MVENKTVKERLISFIKYLKIGQSKFESNCGLANGYVNNIRRSITPEKLQKIALCYPNLNTGWLMTGEGEMLKVSENESENLEPIIEEKVGKHSARMIPFYDAETTGGYNGQISASDSEASLRGYIYAGGWFDGRETAAIRHYGDSMVEYPNGCILAVKEVTSIHLLVPGRNYVIETAEFRVTKRVQKGSSPDSITLYSTNQEKYDDGRLVHEPFDVRFEDIRRIYSVLGYIVNQYGEAQLIRI